MPRIRTVKPEFWSDEKLSPEPDHVRLVFLGMISMADDLGRLVDNDRQIDAFVFPAASDGRLADTREALARLSGASRIIRGTTSSGQRIIQIANWERHQKVTHPSLKSCLPEIVAVEGVTPPPEGLGRTSGRSHEGLGKNSGLDLDPTTYDQRPTTGDRGPAREARDATTRAAAEVQLRQALDERYHEALDDLLRSSRSPKGVIRVLWAYIDPGDGTQAPGGHPIPPAMLGQAIEELLASRDPAFNAAFFRGIVARLQREAEPPRRRASAAVPLSPGERFLADLGSER